jgi:phosphoribosylformylglycinamidine cyclo-ligase
MLQRERMPAMRHRGARSSGFDLGTRVVVAVARVIGTLTRGGSSVARVIGTLTDVRGVVARIARTDTCMTRDITRIVSTFTRGGSSVARVTESFDRIDVRLERGRSRAGRVHFRVKSRTFENAALYLIVPARSSSEPLSYRDAGVDIDAGDALVERIKPYARRTMRPEVLAGIGGFGALIEIGRRFREPVLVAGTDGVGTKLDVAQRLGRHDTIGIDLVAMSVNDILVQGAEPLFFLDYYVCETLDVDVAAAVIRGIAHGCELAGCALIGGETAEHPGTFPAGTYDLAGFAVGVVEKGAIIDGRSIVAGDRLVGIASSGPHSNGFSLIRRILDAASADLGKTFDARSPATLGDALLEPTRIYVKPVLALAKHVVIKGMAHITGGGLALNVPRMLPVNVQARLERARWPHPAIFDWLQARGRVADDEMHRVFNCGIGMVLAVAERDAPTAIDALRAAGEQAFDIGAIDARPDGAPHAIIV